MEPQYLPTILNLDEWTLDTMMPMATLLLTTPWLLHHHLPLPMVDSSLPTGEEHHTKGQARDQTSMRWAPWSTSVTTTTRLQTILRRPLLSDKSLTGFASSFAMVL